MSDLRIEFERLKRNGDEHYERKEYAIAAECYRAALERGPGNADLLFNFAYCLAETKNDADAATFYQQAIQAGSGSPAHNNLGLCYRKLGRHNEARDEFVKATKLKRSHPLYWRNLAACLVDLKEPKAELNALENLVGCDGCTAGDWNNLGRAREREGDVEGGLIAFRYAASADPDECAYFFNIALMCEKTGRVLDAYHACRHSLTLNPGYESATKMLPRLATAAKAVSTSLSTSSARTPQHQIDGDERFAPPPLPTLVAREIGPHDYVNPYTLLNFSPANELPEAHEWFDRPEDWDELLGSLTRRRRALKAELELNDGKLSWLPQLHITDEVVHRVLSDLDDIGWHAHHWAIFRLPLLSQFLTHSDLTYFSSLEDIPYPIVAELAGVAPDDLEHEGFAEFVSPYFRHQWASAIKRALDAENYAGASALFSTSAPVTTADLDEALEPIRRHFARRRETLKNFADLVESGNNSVPNTQLQFAAGEAKLLNVLPTHLGAKLRDDMCFAYRSVSIALANHRGDYASSEQTLKAAERFQVSETIKQRLAEDRTTITDLLRRDQEEKRREEQLTLRLTLKSWFRERTLAIMPEQFIWGEEAVSSEHLNGVRYGITIKYTNGIKTGADSILALRATNGAVISTDWLGEANFSDAVRSVMGLYAPTIMTKILMTLEERGCQIGHLQVSKRGIAFESGIFFTKQHLVPWADAETHVASGNVQVYSRSERKARTTLACREHWNACLLPTLIQIMKSSTK